MPQPKKWASVAERQAAYRQRQAAARAAELAAKGLPATPAISTMPSTQRWRALLATAITTLETLQEEIQDYAQERSDEWQESDRANDLHIAKEQLGDIVSELENITL